MNSLASHEYGEVRAPEYQVILVVEYDDGRMLPLTEHIPTSLLPVGNRKLISYQLDMLVKSGASEVIIVTPREYETHFTEFLSHYARSSSMSIDLVPVDDMMGSVDGLCAVSDRIRGDFIVVRSDFVSQFCLGELVSMHRMNSSDVTMLLTSVKSADVKKDEMDEELMGVCDDGRVVLKTFTNDIDEAVFLPKPLLQKCPTLSLRSDLTDVGVYVMSHWVMELLLMTSTKMASVQSDLVPFLVRRQFQPAEYLLKAMPALQHRGRPLEAIEPWLTATAATSAAALGKPSCTIGLGGRGGTAPAGGAGFPEEKEHLVVELLFNQAAMASPAAAAMGALPSAVSALSLSSPPPTPGGSAAAPLTPMTHSAAAASAGARVQATAVTGSGGVAVTEDISSCCPPPPAGPAAEHSSASTRPSHPSQQSPVRGAAVSGGRQMEADPLRCFAVIYEADGCGPSSSGGVALVAQPINNRGGGGGSVVNTAAASAAAGAGENSNSSSILSCVNCIGAYLNLNKDVLQHKYTPLTPWPRLQNFMKKESSVVGEGTDVSSKTVTIKQSCIGSNCKLGEMTKLNNCVVMDGVTIGENCTIQNSIICHGAVVESNCKLNDCNIGSGYTVAGGSKVKGASFSAAA